MINRILNVYKICSFVFMLLNHWQFEIYQVINQCRDYILFVDENKLNVFT